MSQVLSGILVIVGIVLLVINRNKNDGMRGRTFRKTYRPMKKKKAKKA